MKLVKYLKDNSLVLTCFLLTVIVIFHQELLNPNSFQLGYDFQYQHIFFYSDFKRLISNGQLPFYSLNLFLGNSFWASKSYYLLGDFFGYITLLFSLDHLQGALFLSYLLKMLCACLLINHLAYMFKLDQVKRCLICLMYVFCGWAMMFLEHPMFMHFYSLLPLVFIGIEKILRSNKYTCFILGCSLLFIGNYYLFFSVVIYLVFYWTIRYFQLKELNFKQYLFDTLKVLGYSLIVFLIASFLIIPSIYYLLGNKRLGDNFVLTKKWIPIKIYFDLILKSFIPPFKVNELGHLLFNNTDYNTNQLSLYASCLMPLLIFQVFKIKDRKLKYGFIILMVIEALLLLSPYGSSLMHGLKLANFRWVILIIITNLIILMHVLDHLDLRMLKIGLLTCLGLLCGLILVSHRLYPRLDTSIYQEYYWIFYAMFLIILYYFVIRYKFILLLPLLILELGYGGYKTLRRYPYGQSNFQFKANQLLNNQALDYIKSLEGLNDFYRVYVPYYDHNFWMPHNVNLYYDFKSAYSYDSLPNSYSQKFSLQYLDGYLSQLHFGVQKLDILRSLHFKYYLVKNPFFNLGKKPYSFKTLDISKEAGFSLVKDFGDFQVYEDQKVKPYPIKYHILKDNYMLGEVLEDGLINTTIAYDQGFTVKINDRIVDTSNSVYFLSFKAKKGDKVEITYLPKGFKLGLLNTVFGLILLYIVFRKEKRNVDR